MKIIKIIEPHCDDALLSCFSLLQLSSLTEDYKVEVYTVNTTGSTEKESILIQKRLKENQRLLEFFPNLNLFPLNVNKEIKNDVLLGNKRFTVTDNISHPAFFKKFSKLNVQNLFDFIKIDKVLDEEQFKIYFDDMCWEFRYFLEQTPFFSSSEKDEVKVFIPGGMGNPYHMWIRDLAYFLPLPKKTPVFFYKDLPHALKKRNTELFHDFESKNHEYKPPFLINAQEIHLKKAAIFKEIYKTQGSFAFFESGFFNTFKDNRIEEFRR